MYQFTFRGQWLSINAAFSKHYHQRNLEKNKYKELFIQLLQTNPIPRLQAFTLEIEYNSRMDADNLCAGSKVWVDTMRHLGIIAEDNKHIYKGLSIRPNLELKHNTYKISVIPVKLDNWHRKNNTRKISSDYLEYRHTQNGYETHHHHHYPGYESLAPGNHRNQRPRISTSSNGYPG